MTKGTIDTGTDHLLANLDAGVLTLTFNRPEARNALSGDLLQAFGAQLSDAEINPDVRCVVVTGSGNAFCAGGDVKAMSDVNTQGAVSPLETLIQRQRLNQRSTSGRLNKMPKPTLAVIPALPRVPLVDCAGLRSPHYVVHSFHDHCVCQSGLLR